eukprot:365525-Chlamydomonas_euryale.AAC.9
MPACRPAARGRTRRHTVAALGAGGRHPPHTHTLHGEAPSRYERGRPNRVTSVRWNSVAPFLVWTAAPHGALALWNGPLMGRVGLCHSVGPA